MIAKELISENETAIVVFTKGDNFIINDDQCGSTGFWKINPQRQFDKVIIYKRDSKNRTNEIYIANPIRVIPSPVDGRYIIELSSITLQDITDINWLEFTGSGANPIRYI